MSKGLEALLEDLVERQYLDEEGQEEYDIIEKELKEYQEFKDIAKRYNWDDITSEIFNVNADKKYRDLFSSAIILIQEDYRKARALEGLKELFDFDFALRFPNNQPMLRITNKRTNEYWEIPIPKEKYDSLKKVLL